jgi:hypothetical protein
LFVIDEIMVVKDDDSIVLKFEGGIAKQLRMLCKTLGLKSPGDVVMQALSLLDYSIGSKVTMERNNKVMTFDQFSDKEPLPENNN